MKILFITLSNIGDVILSLPALDSLLAVYPNAEITVLCGGRAAGLFEGSFYIKRYIVYDKSVSLKDKLRLISQLRKNEYDLIVDLKNSALPLLLKAKFKTYPWFNAPGGIVHMRQRHLYKVRKFTLSLWEGAGPDKEMADKGRAFLRKSFYISDRDRKVLSQSLGDDLALGEDKFIVIGPGARSHIKRWPQANFAALSDILVRELGFKIVIAGDNDDLGVCQQFKNQVLLPIIDLCAKTSLKSLAALIERAAMVISNDSAIMHLASYLDRPTLAIFGPTNCHKYGPWSRRSEVVRGNLSCSPCEAAQCKINNLSCMKDIKVEEIYAAAKRLL